LYIGFETGNVCAMIHIEKDDNDTDRETSKAVSDDPGEGTSSSDNEENDLDNLNLVVHHNEAHHHKRL
jgi:hypothetical protein